MIYKLLIIGHFIGDFYVQSNSIAKAKKHDLKALSLHCLYYLIALFLSVLLILDWKNLMAWRNLIITILILTIAHGLIDFIKSVIENRSPRRYGAIVLAIDQILHIITILIVCKSYNVYAFINTELLEKICYPGSFSLIIDLILCALICARPASIFVKTLFQSIENQPKQSITLIAKKYNYKKLRRKTIVGIKERNCSKLRKISVTSKRNHDLKIGSFIGILERETILFLGIMGQYSAIGFVLAAKSVARYKQLEKQEFAEKYLVGTLMSAIIAFICVAIYNYLKTYGI